MYKQNSTSSASTSQVAQHRSSQKPPSSSNKPASQASSTTVPSKRPRTNKDDDGGVIDLTEDEGASGRRYAVGNKGKARDTSTTAGNTTTVAGNTSVVSKYRTANGRSGSLEAEIEELKATLAKVEATRDELVGQMQAMIKQRMTEPERLAEEQRIWYEERQRLDQELIKALKEGTTTAPTPPPEDRDKGKAKADVNAELVEELQAENMTLREKARTYQQDLNSKEETIRQLQHDLTRTKLLVPTPGSTTKTKPGSKASAPDTLSTHIIKFYEELTYLAILTVDTGFDNSQTFNCMVTNPETSRSLAFKLKVSAPAAAGSKDDLIVYEPLSTKHETDPELLKMLDYLTETFNFQHDQLHTFLRGVVDALGGKFDEEEQQQEEAEAGSDEED